ncbi:metal ABC transporter substrate-binding protein [Rhodospirillum rubrum]|uniref:Periplasmic solute binding protein n=1 Tax=Rhodospirillum rubrum (strain ATCC 11170 / ATH 1.1.1 / DSM 467 / LMG 4362 / NCIMB 8255 / S1) TaxID=269796 RepID=Q2RMZ7_RHORT|nr:metal ABC transporter substrate-binding protein [Rhodospirillum rubrum]ABC24498.1 Periplasmic solute binding protein [Rhodospirillum rubrum ATCC 11170]AEO50250.1 periplasmic solute binding protein [Rhodospirillum rubrum F11]MBK5956224.1 metal ABC transporter substrate-binding protein [Rhodospirillum rubrum]QXG80415.1 metal ABC transporter substrate-binding protein [Rhodospirillum rubrum]HAQ00961.1 metal ABC transporter substrate-binding protein [Rhodospirillum rubrum]
MIARRCLLAAVPALGLALALGAGPSLAADPVKVVASFSILGDMVHEIGGERVSLTTLVGADGDAHVYQPTPSNARAVGAADLLVINGLGFEGWMDRLIDSSGYKGPVVIASQAVSPRPMEEEDGHDHEADHDHGAGDPHHEGLDPHAWQSLANGRLYLKAIADGLIAVDPAGAPTYQANLSRMIEAVDALETEVKRTVAAIPSANRKVVTSHDAFGYFASAYGLSFIAPQGVSTDAEASASDVAALIRQIRDEKIPAVFMENISDPRLLKRITAETGAVIGGTLYSDSLSGPTGPAPTYLKMMESNIRTLKAALAP